MLAGAAVIGVALLAQAAPPPLAAPPAAPAAAEHWYGWQILLADAGAFGLLSLGLLTPGLPDGARSALDGVGVLVYVADGPVVHAMHRHETRAGSSGLLRLGLPLFGLLAGFGTAVVLGRGEASYGDPIAWALRGAAVCTVPAVLLDTTMLAWDPPSVAVPPASARFTVFPTTGVVTDAGRQRAAVVGVGGTF
jgi:hypothetical protein